MTNDVRHGRKAVRLAGKTGRARFEGDRDALGALFERNVRKLCQSGASRRRLEAGDLVRVEVQRVHERGREVVDVRRAHDFNEQQLIRRSHAICINRTDPLPSSPLHVRKSLTQSWPVPCAAPAGRRDPVSAVYESIAGEVTKRHVRRGWRGVR